MRLLVCGGRDYEDLETLFAVLDCIRPHVVIAGGATGADALAEIWAINRGVPRTIFKADWTKHGKAAGPIRNRQMMSEGKPDMVLAFPGGRGTENMVRLATDAGIPVVRAAEKETKR